MAKREQSTEKSPSERERRFGRQISNARKAANMTQEDLASKAGTTDVQVSRIESAARLPSRELLERICEVLKLDSEDFLAELRALKGAKAREHLAEEFGEAGT